MGRHEKTSALKILDVAGEASSSWSGESVTTHQGARNRAVECDGGTNGQAPQMASGRRSGSQGDPNVDGCAQARVWSNATATNSPRCPFRWFVGHLRDHQAPLAVVDEGEAPIGDDEMIRHSMIFFKSIAPMSLDVVGECCAELRTFVGGLFLSDVSFNMVMLTIYGSTRGCALAQCIGEMLTEGVHSVIDTLACQGFYATRSFSFLFLTHPLSPFFCGAFGFSLALYFPFGSFFYGLFS